MSQPLATAAGNALEVIEVMETLTGGSVNEDLWELTVALGGEALHLAGIADTVDAGEAEITEALSSGKAAEIFGEMVAALAGRSTLSSATPTGCLRPRGMPRFRLTATALSPQSTARRLGWPSSIWGAGGSRGGDKINPSVGLSDLMALGEDVSKGDPIARIHAATREDAERAAHAVRDAYTIGDTEPEGQPLIFERVG